MVLVRAEPGDGLAVDLERGSAVGETLLGVGQQIVERCAKGSKRRPLRLIESLEMGIDRVLRHQRERWRARGPAPSLSGFDPHSACDSSKRGDQPDPAEW
jgi:hypothetical protein